MADTEKDRKIQRFIQALEAFQLLCKQLDHHAGEVIEMCREETKE